ncbi:hypothetical protein JYP52_21375 [Nitratireductor aquibiodomus]|uniref:hypothetical protein n=1 Tax=Nitratireductor TaxID=245876 RepID=UPI000DE03091|nr:MULTISPECIES: hypothetical protein [Nitratireductor]MBN7763693.1 hypothetical protein [Nitratireductor aquibiodomus]
MLSVVLTGPAIDNAGRSIIRENLIAACHQTGKLSVAKRVNMSTDLLVASRTDTVKAKAAAANGVVVLSYPQFINRYLHGVEILSGGKPNRYMDRIDKDLLVPDFTEGMDPSDLL